MHKGGIIGIDIGKYGNPIFGRMGKRPYQGGRSILQFRWYGDNLYQYSLFDHPLTEEEKRDLLSSFPYIPYNDSVVFENIGGYDERGFPDKDKFQSMHN